MKNTKKKNVVEIAPAKKEMVGLFKTTYHYYRNWVKYILAGGKLKGFRFVKDDAGYTGKISVLKTEVDNAKKVLADYKSKPENKEGVDLWW
jgi:hypothetical protein